MGTGLLLSEAEEKLLIKGSPNVLRQQEDLQQQLEPTKIFPRNLAAKAKAAAEKAAKKAAANANAVAKAANDAVAKAKAAADAAAEEKETAAKAAPAKATGV